MVSLAGYFEDFTFYAEMERNPCGVVDAGGRIQVTFGKSMAPIQGCHTAARKSVDEYLAGADSVCRRFELRV